MAYQFLAFLLQWTILFIWQNNKTIFWTKSPKIKRSSRRNSISITSYDVDISEATKSGTSWVWKYTDTTCYEIYNQHENFYVVDIYIYRSICIQRHNCLFKALESTLLKIPSYYWGLSTLRIKERVFVFLPLKLSLLWRRVRDLFIYNMIKGFKQQRWFILFCSVAELIIPLPTYVER